MTPLKSKSLPLPAMVVGIALLGGAMFMWGRSTAPNPTANSATDETAKEEHGGEEEDGHVHEEGGEPGVITFSPEALQSAGVEVGPVTVRPQLSGLPFNGNVEAAPDNVARVASIVSGRVARLFVSIGQQVQQGQTLALIESRGVGEAQSAYSQAVARLQNARSNYDVVNRQAKAGVFSRAPLEMARRAQVEAEADVRAAETAVRQTTATLQNVTRLARVGSYSRPSLEAARWQYAAALESLKSAQAAQGNATAAVQSAQSEVARRKEIASGGGYSSRPVEEARRLLVAAQSARATAQSEVATTRANLSRAKSLASEGLVSTRDLEAAQTALDTAEARLRSAQSDETTSTQELERQQKLATSNVAGNAEVSEAQSRLASAQADERTRRAEVQRAQEGLRLAGLALNRERQIYGGNFANRREVAGAQAARENAQNSLARARQTFAVAEAALQREERIFRQNLNNTAQIQSARATLVSAESDVRAAQTALSLLRSAPGGSAVVPLRAPLSGLVDSRDLVQGEVVEADKNVMTIVNLSTVHVDMHLPERDISRVRLGAPVSIVVDAVPGRTFVGSIELIHADLDPKTRTVEAHAEIPNPGALRPGMFARGTIGTGSSKLAVMVPADAVQNMDGQATVFVVGDKTGEFKARAVETGATSNGRTLIKSGLLPGERIVVKGAFMVKAQSMKGELGHED
ncbi:cobalt-zinc-cadmium resistance protein CzcB [Abditibacteriota bacterium]|nr:cobalt-zinc-cadmium resistance protein CzcB [Abditibacteriota bacterium]